MNELELKTVQKIRNKYEEVEKSKLDELKALDKKVKKAPTVFSYVFGSISSLVLGTGMCLAMKVIGDMMALGIVVGVVGIGLCSITYPIYKKMLQKRRKKYSKQIIEISDSLIN